MSAGRILGVLALAAAAGVAFGAGRHVLRSSSVSKGAAVPKGEVTAEPLSPLREKALALVAGVVPSKFPDARFAKLAPGYQPDDPALPKGFTSCGYLPCYVGRALGDPKGVTQCGIEQMRINGEKHGVWVKPGGDHRPKPGDLFGIDSPNGKLIVHVGVFIRRWTDKQGREVWQTADAGQGSRDAQEARYVERVYDPRAMTVGGPAGARPLAGWIDLDRWPFPGKEARA